MEQCPIPQVADALALYVRPRSDVTAIRQNLYAYLERHLHLEDSQALTSLNVSDPPLVAKLQEPPNAFSGVRKAYWRALKAHQAAQSRFEDLKAELQDLGSGYTPGAAKGGDGADLLPLLRQREKRRKLQVLDRAFAEIEGEGEGVLGRGVDDLVRETVGEAPVPPSTQRSVGVSGVTGGKVITEERILELKKAVLSARRTVDSHGGMRVASNGDGMGREGDTEVFALQQARNELITWIERQLALIGEAQGEEGEGSRAAMDGDSPAKAVSSEEISRLYDGYLDARERLLQTTQTPSSLAPQPLIDLSTAASRTTTAKDGNTASAQSATLLPFILPLLSAKSEEQSHLQQATHIRRGLKAAEADTDRLMRRMADESHLVDPGASKGRDWHDAANEAGEATKGFVAKKVQGGESAAKEAEQCVQEIREVTGGLERLVDK